MIKLLTIITVLIGFEAMARDILLEEIISDTVTKCQDQKGFLHKTKNFEKDGKICVSYSCAGDFKNKLKIGNQTIKTLDKWSVLNGFICLETQKEATYISERFEKLKNIAYFNCYHSCSERPTRKKCLECQSSQEKLFNCQIALDYSSINCSKNSYPILNTINQAVLEIRQ